jgi:hypothetical protein
LQEETTLKWKILALGSTTTIVAMSLVFTILIASGALVSANPSTSHFTVKSKLGVYSDIACTHRITSINWGTFSPGSSINKTIYIKNLGTTPLTLNMSKTNWNPKTADGPITLTWNRESKKLAANEVTSATFTLGASPNISAITSFSMYIVITGIG